MAVPSFELIYEGLERAYDDLSRKARLNSITIVDGVDKKVCIMMSIQESLLSLLTGGVFSSNKLIENDFSDAINKIIVRSQGKTLKNLPKMFEDYYSKSSDKKAVEIVAGLVSGDFIKGIDVSILANDFLLVENDNFGKSVSDYLQGR